MFPYKICQIFVKFGKDNFSKNKLLSLFSKKTSLTRLMLVLLILMGFVTFAVYINVRDYRRWGQTKQKHNKICVRHHYGQTDTNNVNKTTFLFIIESDIINRWSYASGVYLSKKISKIENTHHLSYWESGKFRLQENNIILKWDTTNVFIFKIESK